MPAQLIVTADGSHSLFVPELNEHYHSVHGAVQESMHVFIDAGLRYVEGKKELNILEVGMGTGLNVLLTLLNAKTQVRYHALEAYPITPVTVEALNYPDLLNCVHLKPAFRLVHSCEPEAHTGLSSHLNFVKHITKLEDFRSTEQFDLVYFDAFAPRVQPELWTRQVFEHLFSMMGEGGALVTYCAKGEVKRNLKAAGFSVEALPGPKGKREMTRAVKR
jgi:tRNA U34 5-methylaminomethyl-2-thiouridine-forming methyltransferase MnmC